MKIARIKETCIYVNDLERTRAFYVEKIGLTLVSLVENRHVFFKAGDSVLLCFIAAQTKNEAVLPPHGATGRIHFAFEVATDDYEDALNKLQCENIEVLHRHVWKKGLRSFYFHDPDENVVEVIEAGVWEV